MVKRSDTRIVRKKSSTTLGYRSLSRISLDCKGSYRIDCPIKTYTSCASYTSVGQQYRLRCEMNHRVSFNVNPRIATFLRTLLDRRKMSRTDMFYVNV